MCGDVMAAISTFLVFISGVDGSSHVIDVAGNDLVDRIAQVVQERLGGDHRLMYCGKQLVVGHRLDEYNIQRNATIDAVMSLVGGMQIFVILPHSGRSITLAVERDDTVDHVLKLALGNIVHLSHQYRIHYAGKSLEGDRTLSDYGVEKESTFYLTQILIGGGPLPISHASMKNPITGAVSYDGPAWREAIAGLNVEGTCTKRQCIVYGISVLAQVGLGTFNMSEICNTAKCPVCSSYISGVVNSIFYNCIYRYEGAYKDESGVRQEVESEERATEKGKFVHFKDIEGVVDTTEWLYLKIFVRKLPSGKCVVM